MESDFEKGKEPLADGGLQILTDLIAHQDSTTWTAMSVFLAAELVLFALYVQALPKLDIYTSGTLGVFGLVITLVSFVVTRRSNQYLEKYFELARRRCHPRDLEIFDVKFKSKHFGREWTFLRASWWLGILHMTFFILWGALYVLYILILWQVLHI